jgi:hypothetical protein
LRSIASVPGVQTELFRDNKVNSYQWFTSECAVVAQEAGCEGSKMGMITAVAQLCDENSPCECLQSPDPDHATKYSAVLPDTRSIVKQFSSSRCKRDGRVRLHASPHPRISDVVEGTVRGSPAQRFIYSSSLLTHSCVTGFLLSR